MKFRKVKNIKLLREYGTDNVLCEYCLYFNKKHTQGTDLHHIFKGLYRTDELWNIITLCKECHVCVHKEKFNTPKHRKAILLHELVAIKFFKKEIDFDKILQMQAKVGNNTILDETMKLLEQIEKACPEE